MNCIHPHIHRGYRHRSEKRERDIIRKVVFFFVFFTAISIFPSEIQVVAKSLVEFCISFNLYTFIKHPDV